MSRVRIVGVGTPFGDDHIGLEIAARIQSTSPGDCEVVMTEQPGVELLELLAGSDTVILLDAVRSGAGPGTVHDLALEDVPRGCRALSSHGIGVADMLALAGVLGGRPRGRFIGIEVVPTAETMDAGVSAEVAAAVPAAVKRVRAWLARWTDEGGGAVDRGER